MKPKKKTKLIQSKNDKKNHHGFVNVEMRKLSHTWVTGDLSAHSVTVQLSFESLTVPRYL